jgi:hypothetical protein
MSSFSYTSFAGDPWFESARLQGTFRDAADVINGGLDEVNLDPDVTRAFSSSQVAEPNTLVVWTVSSGHALVGAWVDKRLLPVARPTYCRGVSLYRHVLTGPTTCKVLVESLYLAHGAPARMIYNDTFDDAEAAPVQHWTYNPNMRTVLLPARSFLRVTLQVLSGTIDLLRVQLYLARSQVGDR